MMPAVYQTTPTQCTRPHHTMYNHNHLMKVNLDRQVIKCDNEPDNANNIHMCTQSGDQMTAQCQSPGPQTNVYMPETGHRSLQIKQTIDPNYQPGVATPAWVGWYLDIMPSYLSGDERDGEVMIMSLTHSSSGLLKGSLDGSISVLLFPEQGTSISLEESLHEVC